MSLAATFPERSPHDGELAENFPLGQEAHEGDRAEKES